MKKIIKVEMEQPKECNVCPFLREFEDDYYTCMCILTSKDGIKDIVGKVDCDCPFYKDDSIVKIELLEY